MTLEQELEAQSKRVLEPLDAMIAQVNQMIADCAEPVLVGRRLVREDQA